MSKKIVILSEKPSQARAYAEAFKVKQQTKNYIEIDKCSIFPDGAIITWGIGHLVELKMPGEYTKEWEKWNLDDLPIIPSNFEFKVSRDKIDQFNTVKKLFQESDVIINACDIDREGSNIFYSILNMTGVKNKEIKRLWINSLEVDEVRKGFKNLHDNKRDLLLYQEAKTRQLSDWLVGINASRLFTLLLSKKGVKTTLSVGRVQSPLVYMIYQRQKEIDNFKPEPFFQLIGVFQNDKGKYEGKAKIKEKNKDMLIELLMKNNVPEGTTIKGKIKQVEKRLKKEKPPRLHSLSTIQTTANKKWKYSPSVVLTTMQNLYEKKLVTYPRTDCNYITDNEFEYLSQRVKEYQKILGVLFEPDKTSKKRYVDNTKVQEHYAIIPTKTIPDKSIVDTLSEHEKNIYFEILKTTLSMFHKDYIYEETNIVTDVNSIRFYTKGKIEVSLGWKSLFEKETKDTSDTTNPTNTLPNLIVDDIVNSTVKIKEGITTPPKPYTEGQLINLMKTAGKMVSDEEDSEILKEIEGIGTEATRSGIIESIKDNGYIEIKKNVVYLTKKGEILCEIIEGNLLASPSMTAKWESYLKKIGQGKGTQEYFIKNIEKFLRATIDKAPKTFSGVNVEKAIQEQKESSYIANCPVCQAGKIVDRKNFYGCSNYKNGCKMTFPKKWSGKNLTKTMIKNLCEKGETNKLTFTSKNGKKFEAYLILNAKENKITFEFPKSKKRKRKLHKGFITTF
ncbi:type IA DNA topoisomerase [Pallidibacillus thermolactis]|uniref:type IA DNA topoisomerase n=1 Tax=Pallidibacillus thermolactis TaxID=251051 RepID=UPI00156B5C40|nr:type IA DNA topoisomerase [Pallidibacillus thermolactis]MCU9601735.1 DNA topoisomerase III [Pallidibacillus thermolactis subsp. kokeshiiformis]